MLTIGLICVVRHSYFSPIVMLNTIRNEDGPLARLQCNDDDDDDDLYEVHKSKCLAGEALSADQLKAEIGTMIMGGFETTAHTLAYTLMCICTKPQAEAAVLSELESLGLLMGPDKSPRDLQFEDTRNMPEISNVIKEAMRLYPVVTGVPRCDQTDSLPITADL